MTGKRDRLRVGFVGSGFIAHFHLKSMVGVRNVDVTGVYSRSAEKRQLCHSPLGKCLLACRSDAFGEV